ncbi:MAG: hypothetical protein ACOCTI_01250 [Phycisphaeraceae bacterium]
MSGAAAAAAAAGGAADPAPQAARVARATKASGVIVRVEPDDLLAIIELNDEPIAVHAVGGFFSKKHQYLTSHRGLAFFCKSGQPLTLPEHCQVVEAEKIWIPD